MFVFHFESTVAGSIPRAAIFFFSLENSIESKIIELNLIESTVSAGHHFSLLFEEEIVTQQQQQQQLGHVTICLVTQFLNY